MRDELEPEDDELNPTSPRYGSIDNGKLGIASDKLEPRDELGMTGNKLGTKSYELETKAELDPTNGKIVPSTSDTTLIAIAKLGSATTDIDNPDSELSLAWPTLETRASRPHSFTNEESEAATDELELEAAINKLRASDELGTADKFGISSNEIGATIDELGTTGDERGILQPADPMKIISFQINGLVVKIKCI